jgi:hypothetical protein
MDRETTPAVEYVREAIDDVQLIQQLARVSVGGDVSDTRASEMGQTKRTRLANLRGFVERPFDTDIVFRKKSAGAAGTSSTKGVKSKHTLRKRVQETEMLSARERREKQP